MPAVRRPVTIAAIAALAALALVAGLAAVPSAFSDSSVWIRDPAGDVRPTQPDPAPFVDGPDIRFVRATERSGRIGFQVVFMQAPPLTVSYSGHYVDTLHIGVSPTGQAQIWGNVQYGIWIDGFRPKNVEFTSTNDRWKHTTTTALKGAATVSGKTVTVSLPVRMLGNAKVIRFSVTARRDGKELNYDDAPDKGTLSLRLR